MLTCESGRVIVKKKGGEDRLFIRLNLKETVSGQTTYRQKDIDTGLPLSKKNRITASAQIKEELLKFSPIGEFTQLSDYCDNWLQKKQMEVEVTTYEGYQYRIKHITDYFTDHPVTLGMLTPDDIDQFYHYLLVKEKSCSAQRDQKGLSNRTIKDIAVLLRTILSDATMLGHIGENPNVMRAIKVKIPKKPEQPSADVYVGKDEIAAFLTEIKGHRLEVPFTLALFFGLRREEILGLRWSAIRNGRLYVEHTVAKLKSTVEKDRTKTDASRRDYPIPTQIMLLLDDIKHQQTCNRELFGDCYHDSDYIFTWEDGRPYTPDYLTKSFKKLVRASTQLDDNLTLHSLRSSCVSILVHEGVDVKDIQAWVGHRDIQTTLNIYARTNQKQQNEVMNCMSDAVFPKADSKNFK